MHESVLKKETIEYLNPKENENFVDATLGEGGHALSILKKNGPKGKVLGIEFTTKLCRKLEERKIERLIIENDSYVHLKKIIKKNNFSPVSGILFDLGLSSWHLEKSERGFSFLQEEPLDMRYSKRFTELTAEEIVNKWPKEKIEDILKDYGQERFYKQIAEKIVKERRQKIDTTSRLVQVIKKAVPSWYQYRKRHFATKTFQAIRITVNNELNNIKRALPQAWEILETGGRIVTISFHSLEDRIAKNYFREWSKKKLLKVITKKPISPTKEEIIRNPRCRSAKLRAAIKK